MKREFYLRKKLPELTQPAETLTSEPQKVSNII